MHTSQPEFKLTRLVKAQRGLSPSEIDNFLRSGFIPDLSQSPPDEISDDQEVLSPDEARELLNVRPLVAGSFLDQVSPHSESLDGETLSFKFDKNQLRDPNTGRWVDDPVALLPDLPSGKSTQATKKLTPATIYKKHSDGATIAQSASGDRRMRWEAGAKKFVIEQRKSNEWVEQSRLGKTAAYNEVKEPDKWFEPVKTGQKTGPSTPPQKPEPTSVDTEPTASETSKAPVESDVSKKLSNQAALDKVNTAMQQIAHKFGVEIPPAILGSNNGPPAAMDLKTGKINVDPSEIGRLEKYRVNKISIGGVLGWGNDKDVWTEMGVHEAGHSMAHEYLSEEQQTAALRAGAEAAGLPLPKANEKMGSSYGWATRVEAESLKDYEHGTGLISQSLSPYGAHDSHEALAEALTEYTLSDNPRSFAKGVGDYVVGQLKKSNKSTHDSVPVPDEPTPEEVAPEISKQADVPTIEMDHPATTTPNGLGNTKKPLGAATKAVFRPGIGDGEIIAISKNDDQRFRWDASGKKFAFETRGVDGTWQLTDTLNKNATYQKIKSGDWYKPDSMINVANDDMPTSDTSTANTSVDTVTPVPMAKQASNLVSGIVAAARNIDGANTDLHTALIAADKKPKTFIDLKLIEIGKRQGFDAKPQLVSKAEMDALTKQPGAKEIFRGVVGLDEAQMAKSQLTNAQPITAQELVDKTKTGDYEPGLGVYGNGFYFSVDKKVADVFSRNDVSGGADGIIGSGSKGITFRAILKPDAKTITYDELHDKYVEYDVFGAPYKLLGDPGVFAAALGYDAIIIPADTGMRGDGSAPLPKTGTPKHAEIVNVINRGALIMEEV